MYIVLETITIEKISLGELSDSVRTDLEPLKEGCDGWVQIGAFDNLLTIYRVGYCEKYPENDGIVNWVFVANQNEKYKRYDEVVKDNNVGLWLATDRRFRPFQSVLAKLATLEVGDSSDISDAVADGLEDDRQIPDGRCFYQCLNDWEEPGENDYQFSGINDGAEWVPVKLEINSAIEDSPILAVSRKLTCAEVEDSVAKMPGFFSVFSKKNEYLGKLFLKDRALTDEEAWDIVSGIQGWGVRLKTGAGVLMGVCKPDDTDKEITKTSLKTGTVPLQTQVSAVNPVITQKSYEVLSIDKHEEFWNISLREAVTKKLSIGRLVLSAIEDDSQDLRQQLTDAFSIDKTLKLEVLEGRTRNLILGTCTSASPIMKDDFDRVESASRSSHFNNDRKKSRSRHQTRDVGGLDCICIQCFNINILKKRTVINDGGRIIPDRRGGRLRTFYRIGYSGSEPGNFGDIEWRHIVSQDGKVYPVDQIKEKDLAEIAGRVHRGLNRIYENLLQVCPGHYDLSEAVYDGLTDVYSELERKLADEDKTLDFPCVDKYCDEIKLESEFLDQLISEELYTVYYNVHCAQIDSDPELENAEQQLEHSDPEDVLKFIENASIQFCDAKGLEWMTVVGLGQQD